MSLHNFDVCDMDIMAMSHNDSSHPSAVNTVNRFSGKRALLKYMQKYMQLKKPQRTQLHIKGKQSNSFPPSPPTSWEATGEENTIKATAVTITILLNVLMTHLHIIILTAMIIL